MTVKDFLSRAILMDAMIDSCTAELDRLRRLISSISTSRLDERVCHSAPNEAAYAKRIERIVDMEQQLNEKIDRLVDVKWEISRYIDSIENPRWQCLLRNRYVLCEPWAAVARELGCSLSTVYRLHNQILDELEKNSGNDIV